MKSVYLFALLLIGSMMLFSGCPVGTDYPPDNPGSKSIDKKLLGTWINNKEDADIQKVVISKGSNNSYDIEVLETGEYYMMSTKKFTGWVTTIGKEKFLYAKPDDEDKYYVYHYTLKGKNSFESSDVGLLVGGIDAVTSIEAFRAEIEASMKMDDCFSDFITWTKVK
ncbi:MAG: hypothetical protein GX437_03860 [Sphingobacteriales bacterium]|nr:hypothetical protein [Sphingobacteriales bacterium]